MSCQTVLVVSIIMTLLVVQFVMDFKVQNLSNWPNLYKCERTEETTNWKNNLWSELQCGYVTALDCYGDSSKESCSENLLLHQ